MLFYYGRRYNSASVASRVVDVQCDHCGCQYHYELARVGTGAASAPYAIGRKGAARSAETQARKDLGRRLEDEAELVPCPKCQWINDDLISGYRRGRLRGWTQAAFVLGIVILLGSLAAVWFLSIGPPADRGGLPYVLIGGPIASLALPGAMLAIRHLIRSRIRPNRDYPLPPQVPLGTPSPLLRDPATGDLMPAGPAPKPGQGGGAWLDFQVGRGGFPPICCACLAPESPASAYRRPLLPAVELAVPMCRPCARRWTRRKWLGALVALGVTAAVGLPAMLALKVDEIVFWLAVAGVGAVTPIVGAMIAGHRAAPVRVTRIDASRGAARLWFRNAEFPERVAATPAR